MALVGATATAALGSMGARGARSSKHSPFFAGWYINGVAVGSVSVTSTIVLPKLKCTKADLGIVPSVGARLQPAFVSYSEAGMFVGCAGGKAKYYPAFTMNGTFMNYPKLKAHAGDRVVLKASVGASGTTLSVVDKTTKGVFRNSPGPAPPILAMHGPGTARGQSGHPWSACRISAS